MVDLEEIKMKGKKIEREKKQITISFSLFGWREDKRKMRRMLEF